MPNTEWDALETQARAITDAAEAAVVVLNGIAARIDAAGVDPVKLRAVTSDLKSRAESLAAAVVVNTPSE